MPDHISRRERLRVAVEALRLYVEHSQEPRDDVVESFVGQILVAIGRAEIEGIKDGKRR